jgi:hypothetical protein
METKTFKATAESAYGNELPNPVEYTYDVNILQAVSEIPVEEQLSASDILLVVNNKRKASARQSAMLKAFDKVGIKAPKVDSTAEGILVAAKQTLKTLIATGKSEDEAKQMAAALFGVSVESLG